VKRWTLSACIWLAAGSFLAPQPATAAPNFDAADSAGYDQLFQRIFANPTDIDATFRFAQIATQRGDYEAAIGALERVLFFNPNLPRVSFELGVLYFKLGSYAMAQSYFETALKGDVPPDVRAKGEAFLAEIARRSAPSRFSATTFTGFRYQTNANAGPDNLLVKALGQDAILSGEFARAPDWNWFGQVALDYSYDLGNQRGDSIETSLFGYQSKQFEFSQFDLGLVEWQFGPRFAAAPGSIHPYAIANAMALADEAYLYTLGGGVSARFPLGPSATIEPSVEYRHRDYQNSTAYPTAAGQTGDLVSAALSMQGMVGSVRWFGRLGYDYNVVSDPANFDFNSYDRFSYDFGFPINLALPFGVLTVTPLIGGSDTLYGAPNPVIDPAVVRNDREFHYGAIFENAITRHVGWRTEVLASSTASSLPNFATNNFSVFFGPTGHF
jgi:hypothetical protein